MTGIRLSNIGKKYCEACRGMIKQGEVTREAGDYNQLCSLCFKEYQHIVSWDKIWDGKKWIDTQKPPNAL